MTEQAANAAEVAPVQQTVQAPNVAVTMDEGAIFKCRIFKGRTMREVADTCMRLGLNPVLVGSSLAVHQMPAAAARCAEERRFEWNSAHRPYMRVRCTEKRVYREPMSKGLGITAEEERIAGRRREDAADKRG